MKITFLGGADEVGASGLLIEIGGRKVLVDCGIRPSPKARYGLAGDQLPDLSLLDSAGDIDAILVTHAHTDHTGALELVVSRYPDVPVYATPPTIALVRVLHQDARRIMQSRLEEEGELPLFDDLAASRLMSAFEPVPFQTRLSLGEGLAATFYPAGHIAGAAMIGLESDEGRVLISGDLSFSPQRTVGGAKLPPFEPDVLLLESTYGGRMHANRAVQERRLVETVRETVEAGGKVLIPAFALGRAQEVLLILNEFQRQGRLPAVPIWADGMVRAVCQVYSSFMGLLPLPFQEQEASFFTGNTHAVQNQDQRNALIWQPEPAVIVSSSGMLAGGPSMLYARALAGLPQHAILLTGYQDEEAPGRRLQEMAERGRGTLWLGKDKVDVQCRLGTYSLSAHADEGQLVSMVETLNPAHVMLVHGDENARASLAKELQARKRNTYLPQAGQSFEFHFAPVRPGSKKGLGAGRPISAKELWQAVAGTAGGYYHLSDLAQVWWGSDYGQAELEALDRVLAAGELYFAPDTRRPDVYRARPQAQVEMILRRRARMAELGDLAGRWVSLRGPGNVARLVRCTALGQDFFWVQNDEGETERAWPEDVLAVHGAERPAESALSQPVPGVAPAWMEPNQALTVANGLFPREARLRKTGYRLDRRVLLLTFDFPDVARERYAGLLAELKTQTGWEVEITPEANQGALFALAQEVLPPGSRVVKGPALYRQTRQVAVTLAVPEETGAAALEEARQRFQQASGFELSLNLAAPVKPAQKQVPAAGETAPGSPWEINAAYAAIKSALEGSTLYRTSLKGQEIVLSFISPQVGERYLAEIEALSRQVGWPLRIHPQPNQGAILEAARVLLGRAGVAVSKGPSIYPERSEVVATTAGPVEEDRQADLALAFHEQTGYRLVLNEGVARATAGVAAERTVQDEKAILVPVERVRLRRYHRELQLDPEKVEKAVERVRRLGKVTPPIQVRRVEDGYLLLDGLYRLRAAEALGLEKIPALVE